MVPVSPWTNLLVDELRRLWGEGYSAGWIADVLCFSRNAIIGKANRLGLRRRPAKPVHDRRSPKPVKKKPPPPPPPPPAPPPSPAPPVRARPKELLPSEMRRRQLIHLREHHCRWPVGDPRRRPFYFCANDREHGEVYCQFHMKQAYQGE